MIIYLVASHVNKPQILRLLERLSEGSGRVLLHHDQRQCRIDASDWSRFGNVDPIPSRPITWGDRSQIDMLARCLAYIDALYDDYSWVVHLSGQDYPIRPVSEIEQFLERSDSHGYFNATPAQALHWELGLGRYAYVYPPRLQLSVPGPVLRPFWNRANRLKGTHEPLPRKNVFVQGRRLKLGFLPDPDPLRDMQILQGSPWWSLSRTAVRSLLRTLAERPEVLDHYARSGFAAIESMIPTVLAADSDLRLEKRNDLRYVQWSCEDGGHPDLLRAADMPAALASGCHFARKFDTRIDREVLDIVDTHVHASDGRLHAPAVPPPERLPLPGGVGA
jgi:hypothetical protein